MPRFGNFLKNITTGTYADEFAENHFHHNGRSLQQRRVCSVCGHRIRSFPRNTGQLWPDEDVLPRDSLTEDYRLSLTLFEKGIRMYYALERAPRIGQDNKLKWEFIATRSLFPKNLQNSRKAENTRWILGITMQSFKFQGNYSRQKTSGWWGAIPCTEISKPRWAT